MADLSRTAKASRIKGTQPLKLFVTSRAQLWTTSSKHWLLAHSFILRPSLRSKSQTLSAFGGTQRRKRATFRLMALVRTLKVCIISVRGCDQFQQDPRSHCGSVHATSYAETCGVPFDFTCFLRSWICEPEDPREESWGSIWQRRFLRRSSHFSASVSHLLRSQNNCWWELDSSGPILLDSPRRSSSITPFPPFFPVTFLRENSQKFLTISWLLEIRRQNLILLVRYSLHTKQSVGFNTNNDGY